MSVFTGKHIIIGITGGIAAYKAAELTRRLMDDGAEVRIVMTTAATGFVTPLTFQALSGHPVLVDNDNEQNSSGMSHIELARWADAIVIAPASANTIAKLAHGRADNLLTTLCLASEANKSFAPAMNRVMWEDASTQQNCTQLRDKGWTQLGPDSGLQACGETGAGRMLDIADIRQALASQFKSAVLCGVNVVITAGPTFEAIDPVRYIGNRSSGRMGYAMAQAAREAGASVTLISGPVHLAAPEGVSTIRVESAEQMKQAVLNRLTDCHLFISAAAVSDYRVAEPAAQKIKKTEAKLALQLVKNDDIVSLVANHKTRPFVVGFAAETENLLDNAKAKLSNKNLDMIIANDVSDSTSATTPHTLKTGFDSEYNAVYLLSHDDNNPAVITEQAFPVARKTLLARQLIDKIAEHFKQDQQNNNQYSA